jgi:hypothetical protein
VAVVETCADELTIQIDNPIRIVGEDGFIGTDSEKLTVFFQKSLLQGKAAGVNLSVNICNLHGIPSFSLDFIGFSPGLQGLFAATWLPKEKDFAII